MCALLIMLVAVVTTFVFASASDLSRNDPLANFEISQDGTTVVVVHAGGDVIDAENLYVVSESGGLLGNYAGTDGQACETAVSTVQTGTECHIPEFSGGELYIVWHTDGRTELLCRGVMFDEL